MNKIKFYRNKAGLTLEELAQMSELALSYISTLERDEEGTTNPSKKSMEKIATALKRTVPEVFYPKK
jgi:transcriptional regulator with XRE-family HTH domain